MPAGSARYWSWLFAARPARDPLLGIFALAAEWRAVTDPGLELSVAQIKLAWWRDELTRLIDGVPLHPITRYLAALPSAAGVDFEPLHQALEAAAAQVAGVPLERAAELPAHARAMYGAPLLSASLLTGVPADRQALDACLVALSVGEYLARTLAEYRREARAGRVVFAVDELLRWEIDNEDLIADQPSGRLQKYLADLRSMAARHFADALVALAPADRSRLRHLPVLAALGARHLARRGGADFRVADLYNAWTAARRAAAAAGGRA